MYYIPSAPVLKMPQTPSLFRFYSYGGFLCDRTFSLLNRSTVTSYLADIPPRLIVGTIPESDDYAPQFLNADRYDVDETLDTSSCPQSSLRDGGGLVIPVPPAMDLCLKSGDGSLLVRMGLVPSSSQESGVDAASRRTSEEDMEAEVFRNTSFDGTEWHERSLYTQGEGPCDQSLYLEPHLDTQPCPSCTSSFSESLSSASVMLLADTSASSSAFFRDMLASSSPSKKTGAKNFPVLNSVTAISFFPLSMQSPYAARFNLAADDTLIEETRLSGTQDFKDDIFSSTIPPDEQHSFELDFPMLPSPNDAAEFLAEAFAFMPYADSVSNSINLSHDLEPSGSSLHTSATYFASSSSEQSFAVPILSSMEDLLQISLDIPDLPFDSSFSSIHSLCQLPTCASADDLSRVQLPVSCEGEDDDDAFEPLPPNTTSPFQLAYPFKLECFKHVIDHCAYLFCTFCLYLTSFI
ncbi:hypothetical protein JB92DRAFT_3134608 [Gautieria morchelliformis]|nr:hypothetical protein JB92DRAFT_3134608 [Gautieria morchelliformis]